MEFNSSQPIYQQVVLDIEKKIVTGQLSFGQKLPSIRELALQYSINPNTASRVYSELESAGISYTKRGMGTFVTEDTEKILELRTSMAKELLHSFLFGMEELGFSQEEASQMIQTFQKEIKISRKEK